MTTASGFDFSHLDIDQKIVLRAQLEGDIEAELERASQQPLAPGLLAELQRRSAAFHAGLSKTYSWEEVQASLERDDP